MQNPVRQMRSFNRYFILTVFVLFLGVSQVRATDTTGTLTIHVQGLESGDGNLLFTMFDSEKNFLKNPIRKGQAEIIDLQGSWVIQDLPYGTYAVLVHHDTNSSTTMERHWYGPPKEPTGSSNDAPAKFGPPKFKDARFQFNSPTLTLTITVGKQ